MSRLQVQRYQCGDGFVPVGSDVRMTVRKTHPEKVVYPHRADSAGWFILSGTMHNAATMSSVWQPDKVACAIRFQDNCRHNTHS
jgi:hypothetical protein